MPSYDFEWFKKWEFNPRENIEINILKLRQQIVPDFTEQDWRILDFWFNSKIGFFEDESFCISENEALRLAGRPLTFNKVRTKLRSLMRQNSQKSFDTDKIQQFLALDSWLWMITYDDFSPLITAHKYYGFLENLPSQFETRNNISGLEFDDAIQLLRAKDVSFRFESGELSKKNLCISGLVRRRGGLIGSEQIYIDHSPQNYTFDEWLEQMIEYRFKISKSQLMEKSDVETHEMESKFEKENYETISDEWFNPTPILEKRTVEKENPKSKPKVKNSDFSTVPTHLDYPSEIDRLGRQGLADYLGAVIKRVRLENTSVLDQAFLIHLDGSWGSGKSTLLNLLSGVLNKGLDEKKKVKGEKWLIVNFNAWQHQRFEPPWWYLMDAVFKSAVKQSDVCNKISLLIYEYWWRFKLNPFSILMVLLVYGVLGFVLLINHSTNIWSSNWFGKDDGIVEGISKGLTVLTIFCGFLWTLSKSLLPNSAKTAAKFVESTSDPFKELTSHFQNVINKIGFPTIVLIDDLDRCQAKYVVEFLEGLQTLFRESKVTYVVSADKKWLCESYLKIYNDFTNTFNEPGKPLGYFFVDKIFQLSFGLPPIPEKFKKQYWEYLIQLRKIKKHDEFSVIEEAKKAFRDLKTENEIREKLTQSEQGLKPDESNDDFFRVQALRAQAVLKLAEPDTSERTAHALEVFAPLLEANPREMKRLVNAYGIERTVDILRGGDVELSKLALWTILKLRWPLLGEYLLNHPKEISRIAKMKRAPAIFPDNLKPLFGNSDLINLIKGKLVGGPLDESTLRKIANRFFE